MNKFRIGQSAAKNKHYINNINFIKVRDYEIFKIFNTRNSKIEG